MSRVLIVDDDPPMLDLLEAILLAEGHDVATAKNGIEALGILESPQGLDLFVIDVLMPGLNGFNLARMARVRRPSLKILYISAASPAQLALDKGERLGKLLSKPFERQELVRAVSLALATGSPGTAVPDPSRHPG